MIKKDPIQRIQYTIQTGLVLSKNCRNPKSFTKVFSRHTFNPNWWSSCSYCSQSIFNLNKLSRRTKKKIQNKDFHSVGKIFRVCHDFLLKLHCMCVSKSFQDTDVHCWKEPAKHSYAFWLTSTWGQWHKTATTPVPFPGIPAFCFNDPHYSGNGCRTLRAELRVSSKVSYKVAYSEGGGWRGPSSIPGKKDTRDSHSLGKWFCKWICSLGCISDTAALIVAEVKWDIM